MYAQAMEITGLSYDRLAHYVNVCRRFPFERRRHTLTFGHHEILTPKRFSTEEQDFWLDEAERFRWNASELRRQVNTFEREARNDKLAEDGVITVPVSEPQSESRSEPQFDWLDPATGEIGDGDAAPSEITPTHEKGAWVCCPECGHKWPWSSRQ